MPEVLIKKLIERGAIFHDCDPLNLKIGDEIKVTFITPSDSIDPPKTFIGRVGYAGYGNLYLLCKKEL